MGEYPKTLIIDGLKCKAYFQKSYYEKVNDYVRYEDYRGITRGEIKLPFGWQDMDRTWTSQDICWIDRFDCKTERG